MTEERLKTAVSENMLLRIKHDRQIKQIGTDEWAEERRDHTQVLKEADIFHRRGASGVWF